MCGIAGILGYREGAALVDRAELIAMRDAMTNRGPDGSGEWISPDGRSGLAHRRLAIIDLSPNGRQPMSTADGRFHITYNGEIYNYRELRAELEARGWRFRTESDTEVLLQLFAERGTSMVYALRGMFAFAIWDEVEKRLFLARDPFGIKPLYYSDDGATLRFASQVKALMAGGAVGSDPDSAGHVGFFLLGSVPEPFTVYRRVKALPAGHTLCLAPGKTPALARYFDVAAELAIAAQASTKANWHDELGSALRDSVRAHMVADVPVGLFLSSGLDSSTVAALAAESASERLRSITLGFQEYRGTAQDEVPLAAATADHVRTSHTTRWIDRDTFESELDRILAAMDQPSIDGVNTYFVSRAAAQAGMKVALSGLGGDELFAGYPSFHQVPRMARWLRAVRSAPRLGRALRRIVAPMIPRFASPKFASLLEYGGSYSGAYFLRRGLYMNWELGKFTDSAFLREGWEELDLLRRMDASTTGLDADRQRVAALEITWYMRNQLLRDADWAGMAHSVEIRVPLVDVHLFRVVAPMLVNPAPPTKHDAIRALAAPLPAQLLQRRKTGFSIPVHEWARRTRIARGPQRKLRNWAHIVYRPYKPLRAAAFVSDAFGGHGGIALFNRDFLTSLCAIPGVSSVDVFPRIITNPLEKIPDKLKYHVEAANGKLRYVATVARYLLREPNVDMVLCGHINLLPLAVIAKKRWRAPLLTFIHGIDAWTARSRLRTRLLPQVDRFVAVSEVTRARFDEWSRIGKERIAILPNAVHPEWYGPGAKPAELVERYGIEGKTVLMTLGRLVSSERYKGFDEVLEAMPGLLHEIPQLVYVIGGDGNDRERLERKAKTLGVASHVRFTGLIRESEKADHYRLADAYVMPSRGEGFGIVFLEAMACGVPAVASIADGGREALRGGELGILVDPTDTEDIKRGIREALGRGRGAPPPGLEFFNFDNFKARTDRLIAEAVRRVVVVPD